MLATLEILFGLALLIFIVVARVRLDQSNQLDRDWKRSVEGAKLRKRFPGLANRVYHWHHEPSELDD